MQKFDFQYKRHELDELNLRSVYEPTYELAVESFIDWIHHQGYIGYFENKTIIGNPIYRNHISYSDDLTKTNIDVYVLQYTLLDYQADLHDPTEQKKVRLFMSDAIEEFIEEIKDLQSRHNVKKMTTYKGTLIEFDYTQL
jgi:hypothetical protein